jgi:hypothetical protein
LIEDVDLHGLAKELLFAKAGGAIKIECEHQLNLNHRLAVPIR